MNIQQSPFPIDFLGNNPEFVIRTSPNRVEGRRYRRAFEITSLTAGTLTMETAHGTFTFTVKQNARDDKPYEINTATSVAEIHAQLRKKIAYNRLITRHYSVQLIQRTNKVSMILEAYERLTEDQISITSSGNAGEVTAVQAMSVSGLTRRTKSNYHVIVQFETETQRTPELIFEDNNGRVKVGTAMLSSWMKDRTVPRLDETFGVYTCPELMLKAKMLFTEAYENDEGAEEEGTTLISQEITLLNAEVKREDRMNNRPDWISADSRKMWRKTDIDIYGQDNNDTIRTDTETEQFLYVCNLTSLAITKTATITATCTNGTETATSELVFPAMSICRIPVAWKKASTIFGSRMEDPLKLNVEIPTAEGKIKRTYIYRPRPYEAVTILLNNRCNILDGMTFKTVAEELETKGDLTETSSFEKYDITGKTKYIKLRTGMRTQKELARIAEAASYPDSLFLDGRHLWHVTFKPDTITVKDTAEDLLDIEITAVKHSRTDRLSAVTPVINVDEIMERETTLNTNLLSE